MSNNSKSFIPVYFSSSTKAVINSEYNVENTFEEISYRIDNWTNGRSGWRIKSVEAEYVNITNYSPLSESTYIVLSHKVHLIKGPINIFKK